MPDKSLTVEKLDCKGGKKSKERYTVMLCTNWTGDEKPKPVVIGKSVFANSYLIVVLIFFMF